MSLQRLLKVLSISNSRHILSPVSITSICSHQQLKYCSKKNSKHIDSENSPKKLKDKCVEKDIKMKSDFQPAEVKLTVYFIKEKVEKQITAQVGQTVLDAILKDNSDFMTSACDGQLICRTCHCLVEEKALYYFSQPDNLEEDLLDAFANAQFNSRLACQMEITEEFDHARLEIVPELDEDEKKPS